MNCTRVRRLMPLYVGGDLDAEKARAVFEHLRSCAGCAAAEAAVDSNRRMVRTLEPPDFEDEYYDGIRRSVLDEIAARHTAPQGVLALLFGRRRRFVFATMAAVLVSSMTLTVMRREPVAEVQIRPSTNASPPVAPPPTKTLPQAGESAKTAGPRVSRKHPPRPRKRVPPVTLETVRDPALATDAGESWPEMQRIELQTSDPNIRIIWFAPKQEGAHLGRS
jgi:anti-sigma factor RsiW